MEREIETGPIHHREITLADGRYMIFYTFDEGSGEDQQQDDRGKDQQDDDQGEDV